MGDGSVGQHCSSLHRRWKLWIKKSFAVITRPATDGRLCCTDMEMLARQEGSQMGAVLARYQCLGGGH